MKTFYYKVRRLNSGYDNDWLVDWIGAHDEKEAIAKLALSHRGDANNTDDIHVSDTNEPWDMFLKRMSGYDNP